MGGKVNRKSEYWGGGHAKNRKLLGAAPGTDLEGRRGRGSLTINGRLLVSLPPPIDSGIGGGKILSVKRSKFDAKGAILENSSDILEKLFLKNATKSKNFAIFGLEKISLFIRKICLLKL